MSEPLKTDAPAWRISGHDAALIKDLRQVLRFWLPGLQTGQDVLYAGAALEDLERLELSGRPPGRYRITLDAIGTETPSVSVRMFISATQISLGLLEIEPGRPGMRDQDVILDLNGTPIKLTLTPMGSFDRSMFEQWSEYALENAQGMDEDNAPIVIIQFEGD